MLPVLQIGPLSIQTPGLVLILSLWIGLNQSEKHATKYEIDPNSLYKLTMLGLVCGIIGARIGYIIRFPGAFSGNILSIFSLSPDMLDVSGGILTGIIALLNLLPEEKYQHLAGAGRVNSRAGDTFDWAGFDEFCIWQRIRYSVNCSMGNRAMGGKPAPDSNLPDDSCGFYRMGCMANGV